LHGSILSLYQWGSSFQFSMVQVVCPTAHSYFPPPFGTIGAALIPNP
jgi:hypothetical protein